MTRRPPDDLRSAVFTLPNAISAFRIVLVPFFVLAVLGGRTGQALLIFFVAGISDLLDGFTARLFHVRSRLGMLLDPAGDKLLMAASYIVLTLPSAARPNAIPLGLTVLVFLRDILIVIGALIAFRLWRQTAFPPSLLGKFNTAFQVVTVFLVLLFNDLGRAPGWMMVVYAIAIFLTFGSGADYFIYGLKVLKEHRNPPAA
ncbi:MAG: CDP-alcohol phosphatidyltransferase family protein [Candidatus Aminicenantales bacterium]